MSDLVTRKAFPFVLELACQPITPAAELHRIPASSAGYRTSLPPTASSVQLFGN